LYLEAIILLPNNQPFYRRCSRTLFVLILPRAESLPG
jgi:hypothetical protein